jgi:tRNA(adenine34) deaminase
MLTDRERCTLDRVVSDAATIWLSLSPPWQTAFEQAWASWRSGSAGVGAVITRPDGSIAAVGRNRISDARNGPGPLAGTYMAHAEMNALACLPAGRFLGYALYTTFEPCFMCAATMTGTYRIPRVLFAAYDPAWKDLDATLRQHPAVFGRLPEREHLGGPYGALAHVLHVTWLVQHAPGFLDAHRRLAPRHLTLAQELIDRSVLRKLDEADAAPTEVAQALWSELQELASSGG